MHFPAVGILNLVDHIVKAALDWRPHFDEETFMSKLTLFYERHNPDKVDTVEALASKHRGFEDDLIQKLETRYKASFDEEQRIREGRRREEL